MDPDYKYESDKDRRLVEDEIFSDLDELIAHLKFVDDMADLERRLTVARDALTMIIDTSPSLEHAERMADRALKLTAPKL